MRKFRVSDISEDTVKIIRSTAIFIFITLLTACSGNLWISDKYDQIQSETDRVTILFPHVQYYEQRGEVNQAIRGHSLFVSNTIADILEALINEGDFIPGVKAVRDTSMLRSWIPRYFVGSLEKAAFINDYITESKNRRFFPLIPELQPLIDEVGTGYFLFVKGLGYGTSENTKMMDIIQAQFHEILYDQSFSYDYQWYGLELDIYLVDKATNEIIWHNHNGFRSSKYDPLSKESVRNLCRKLLS